jgi:hypothetical protein
MGTMELKNDDVYALPDGTEFVARVGPKGVYSLYAMRLGVPSAPTYAVDGSGQFLSEGRRTRWHVGDLHATGRTLRPEIQRTAAADERSTHLNTASRISMTIKAVIASSSAWLCAVLTRSFNTW